MLVLNPSNSFHSYVWYQPSCTISGGTPNLLGWRSRIDKEKDKEKEMNEEKEEEKNEEKDKEEEKEEKKQVK